MTLRLLVLVLLVGLGSCGCSSREPVNGSFPTTVACAKAELRRMRSDPMPLTRPVVVVGGWLDPGLASYWVANELRRATGDERITSVAFPAVFTFDRCRDRLLEHIEQAFPSSEPGATVEVDVVGVSMGGLVARYAAIESNGQSAAARRLRMARLFTISTPHRGAEMASAPALDPRHVDMRPGSDLLRRLDAALPEAEYELLSYVRLGDVMVGPGNAAPVGATAWWVPNRPLAPAHMGAWSDQRILADVFLRLRGETPLSHTPPAPLPDERGR